MRSKVVVDASGYFGMVRKQLPSEMGIDRDIANQDLKHATAKSDNSNKKMKNTNFLRNLPEPSRVTSGYIWISPKGVHA